MNNRTVGFALGAGGFPEQILRLLILEGEMDKEQVPASRRLREARTRGLGFILKARSRHGQTGILEPDRGEGRRGGQPFP